MMPSEEVLGNYKISKLVADGIPVVCIGGALAQPSQCTVTLATDVYQCAYDATLTVLDALNYEENIVAITGAASDTNSAKRLQGVADACAQYSKVTLLDRIVGATGESSAPDLVKQLLQELGVSTWAVIHCPEVGIGLDENDQLVEVPSLKLPDGWIAGTVGAGNAFCAGALVMNFLFITTGTVACIVLAALLYYVRSRRATKTFQTMLITPNFVSYVIVGYVVFAILSPVSGTLNVLMQKVGLKKIDWYTKPDAWWWILPIVNIWKGVGMGSILYYATFMGIDPGLFEAAELDGANSLQKFWHVMLPSIKTILIIQTILNIGNIFSADFGMFYNVTRNVSALYPTTDVLNTYIYRIMRVDGNLSLSAAAGLAQSVVGMILVIATNAIVRKIEPESSLF